MSVLESAEADHGMIDTYLLATPRPLYQFHEPEMAVPLPRLWLCRSFQWHRCDEGLAQGSKAKRLVPLELVSLIVLPGSPLLASGVCAHARQQQLGQSSSLVAGC